MAFCLGIFICGPYQAGKGGVEGIVLGLFFTQSFQLLQIFSGRSAVRKDEWDGVKRV